MSWNVLCVAVALAACDSGGGDETPAAGDAAAVDAATGEDAARDATDAGPDSPDALPGADAAPSADSGDLTDAAPPPDAALPPPDAAPTPCPPAALGDGPVVRLEWGATWETHLPPGFAGESLGLDDQVHPRPYVDGVRVELVFTRAGGPEAVTLDEDCPTALPIGALRPDEVTGEVIAADVIVSGGGRTRTGRVTLPIGDAKLEVNADDAGDGAPWWLLFEPAAGPARLWVMPVEPGSTWEIEGVPDMPGTVALVRSDALALHSGVTHAAPGFTGGWRRSSTAWYAATVVGTDEPVRLRPAGRDATPPPTRSLAKGVELAPGGPGALLPVPPEGTAGALRVGCGAELIIDPVGFVETDLGVGEPLGPIGPHRVPVECAGETTTLNVALRPMNGRGAAVRVRVKRGER